MIQILDSIEITLLLFRASRRLCYFPRFVSLPLHCASRFLFFVPTKALRCEKLITRTFSTDVFLFKPVEAYDDSFTGHWGAFWYRPPDPRASMKSLSNIFFGSRDLGYFIRLVPNVPLGRSTLVLLFLFQRFHSLFREAMYFCLIPSLNHDFPETRNFPEPLPPFPFTCKRIDNDVRATVFWFTYPCLLKSTVPTKSRKTSIPFLPARSLSLAPLSFWRMSLFHRRHFGLDFELLSRGSKRVSTSELCPLPLVARIFPSPSRALENISFPLLWPREDSSHKDPE